MTMTATRYARTPLLGGLVLAAGLAACASNPVTGEREFSLMSEAQEVRLGQQLEAEVRKQMGVYDDPELQRYVEQVGLRLAAESHRPRLPWHFTIVNEPAVNAFALPGGYIYLTRGIMPFLDSEAELAGVLGHEIGHVTARHAAQQYTKATSAGVGLAVLGIFVPESRPFQGVAETALGVLFLKHGRDDELQADRLGAEYAARSGWDPGGVAGMLATLERLDEASSSRRGVPGWLATHPDPGDRVQTVQPAIRQARQATVSELATNHDNYLRRIDGIVFGDSPEQGVVRGRDFLHQDLRFRLTFPDGWEIANAPDQVAAKQPGTEVYVVLQLVQNPRGGLDETATRSMQNAGFRLVEGGRDRINGLPAYVGTYEGRTRGIGNATAHAAHIQHSGNVYILVGLAGRDVFPRVRPEFARTIASFTPLSREDAERIRPNRIDLYVVRSGDTWESIAVRAGEGIIKASTLAIMNHYRPDQQPSPGQRIKIVVGG